MVSQSNWENALLSEACSLQDAIQNLDKSGLKIVLILDGDHKLQGTISDGDIRRGLLQGMTLDEPVLSVVNHNPVVAPVGFSRDAAKQLMLVNKIQQLPILDEGRHVIGLHVWDEVSGTPQRENLMIIMAGGKGVRLRPHTENCPKPLLPVAGKPMMEHILERAKLAGFRRFVISVHYLGYMIEEYFGDGSKWDVQISYLHEDVPLGTAGALAQLSPSPSLPFIVTNGDVLTDINYGELVDFHIRQKSLATMAIRMHEWQHPYGVVHTNGIDIIGFEEKPVARTHINAGVYALDPQALKFLPNTHCDMPTLFGRLQSQKMRTVAYPMHEPWLDVGRADDYAQANVNEAI